MNDIMERERDKFAKQKKFIKQTSICLIIRV